MGAHEATDAQLAIARALKLLLKEKPLRRVTVAQLCRVAVINRQTFYYHFNDIVDAAAWVFAREVADHILQHASYEQWADGLEQLMVYMHDNAEQARAVIDSLPWSRTERFFHATLRQMMTAVVDELLTLSPELQVQPADRDFVIQHYTVAVWGHIAHWLAGGMQQDPHGLVRRIHFAMQGHVHESLERFHTHPGGLGLPR
ncbi:TetR-like C-terminal domain-containing protein [Corynebacterium gerontici]|uniref:HTH-type dhaKLM operon transcriptional activator DhaS n=2 Tax=Corynebacterium gerontici TaxID=2079234 RepID=A0A3G6IYM5_9CORY|nr:HTH-type dhaKLM operon transcriptional activator DhaS [Corynebacterium gerontici]